MQGYSQYGFKWATQFMKSILLLLAPKGLRSSSVFTHAATPVAFSICACSPHGLVKLIPLMADPSGPVGVEESSTKY